MNKGHINDGMEEVYDELPSAMEAERYRQGSNNPIMSEEHEPDTCWNRFTRGMRSCWATRQTENMEENRELYIKTTLRELLIYIIFLAVLMILTFMTTSRTMFYYTNILNKLFLNAKFEDGSGSFAEASTTSDFWKFMTGPLIGGLYWDKWYNGVNVSASERNFIYYENKLIGVPRLRQVRVSSNSCVVHDDFKNEIKECFAEYSVSTESKTTFGLGNSTAWNYTGNNVTEAGSTSGTVASYEGGGYYIDLSSNAEGSQSTIQELFQNLWIDRGTRAVFIDFTVYNANINLFCVIRLFAEFPATGGIIPNYEFRTVRLLRYVTPSDYFVMACELAFIIFIIYYAVEEILEIKRHKIAYFFSFWNILDILVIVISIICSIFNVYRTVEVNKKLQKLLESEEKFQNFDFLSFWQLQFTYAIAITVFLAWIKIFKYISFDKTMTQLNSTLSRCSKDLAGFTVMFAIVFFAFAQLGYLLFGTQVKDFRDFIVAIFTLLRIILGDFDFQQLEAAHRILGPLYFMMYVFFVFFVLINMFLAIINDTYAEVKAELANQQNEFEMGDFFKERANKLMEKLHLKRDKIVDIQKAINNADMNNDAQLDFDEWRAELKTRGYAEGEIEAVFSKYDTDGDRVLNEYEQKKMQNELEGEKAAINKVADQINETSDLGNSGEGLGRSGVNIEEFRSLSRRVDQLETSISSIVSKIENVLDNLDSVERTKSKRRETLGQILNTLNSTEDMTDEERKSRLEALVQDEISKLNQDTASSKSGRSRKG